MIGDNPQVIKKQRSKTAWSESLFLKAFNHSSRSWRLLACEQDFNTFDYWMIDVTGQKPPRIVELKAHIHSSSGDRNLIGCDYIKLQKLKSLAVGTKAYVFHLLEDVTLVQDVETPIDIYKEIEFRDRPVLLGLIKRDKVKNEYPIGLKDLRLLRDVELESADQSQSHDAIALEIATLARQQSSHG